MSFDPDTKERSPKRIKLQEKQTIFLLFRNLKLEIAFDKLDEIGFLKKFESTPVDNVITLPTLNEDENVNEIGFLNCTRIVQLGTDEKSISNIEALVPTLAVSHYLEINQIKGICGDFMKANVDETNCLVFYNACKKYGLKIVGNEIFYWILINLMCLKGPKKLNEDQLKLIDKDLLSSLVQNVLFVVSNEYDLYDLLKQWTLHNTNANKELKMDTNDDVHQDLFGHIRLSSLLSYPDKVHQIFKDRIISEKLLNQTMYEMNLRVLNIDQCSPQDEEIFFRFARRIPASLDVEITTDFFYAGVVLKYKFNSKRLAIERLSHKNPSNTSSITNHGPVTVRTNVILYGHSNHGRCNSEKTATCVMDLNIGRERMMHNWGKAVIFPCILFVELQISCGSQIVDVE